MGFLDFLNPDERRWCDEAKREAKEYRQDAKEYLSEAKDYEDDYKELKIETRHLVNELSGIVKSHNDYKVGILKELGTDITNTIDSFKRFNINSRVIKMPKIDTNSTPSIPIFTVSNIMADIPGGNFNPINIILSAFSDPYKDRDKAMEQKDKAREYLFEVKSAVSEMRYVYESLNNTRRYINDERQMLNQLMDKVRSIMQQLNDAMNQQRHTETSAKHMNAVCKIAEMLKSQLETQIISKNGDIQNNYKNYSQQIRKINDAIPAKPDISGSWINNLDSFLIQY